MVKSLKQDIPELISQSEGSLAWERRACCMRMNIMPNRFHGPTMLCFTQQLLCSIAEISPYPNIRL